MPVVAANIVDPKVKRVEGAFVNLHEMPGGHSLHQLNKSIRMRILGLDRTPKGLRAQVVVHNVGAGHSVPTGIPAGICTVESKASNPCSEPEAIGTPMTGSAVWAAITPARWAAIPAAAMIT